MGGEPGSTPRRWFDSGRAVAPAGVPDRAGTAGSDLQPEYRNLLELLAVCVAANEALDVGGAVRQTGIFKHPAARAVEVTLEGLKSDFIGDAARHGGRGQEIYLFSQTDADWWADRLGRPIPPGYFGENLRIDQWWDSPRVGDRIRFGDVALEISFPRVPCATLGARVGDPSFLRSFIEAGRPGLYARVLHGGTLAAPCPGQVDRGSPLHPTAAALFKLWHTGPKDRAALRVALDAPIAERARAAFNRWLSGPE